MSTTPPSGSGSPRRARLDPSGKRALFEAPPQAPADQLATGPSKEGRDALFSVGPARTGTVVVSCSSCEASTRTTLADLGVRVLGGSLWNPLRRSHPHWLRCPACGERTWVAIDWLG